MNLTKEDFDRARKELKENDVGFEDLYLMQDGLYKKINDKFYKI